MRDLIVPLDLVDQYDSNALMVYTSFQTRYCAGEGYQFVYPEPVGKMFDYEIPLTKNKREYIRNIFGHLYELGYLKMCGKLYMVDTDMFYNYERFIKCSRFAFDELNAAPKLFHHYLILKDCEGKAFSLEYYANREGVSTQTIINRNKDLAVLHLIEINTSTYNPASGKRVGNNIYTVLN